MQTPETWSAKIGNKFRCFGTFFQSRHSGNSFSFQNRAHLVVIPENQDIDSWNDVVVTNHKLVAPKDVPIRSNDAVSKPLVLKVSQHRKEGSALRLRKQTTKGRRDVGLRFGLLTRFGFSWHIFSALAGAGFSSARSFTPRRRNFNSGSEPMSSYGASQEANSANLCSFSEVSPDRGNPRQFGVLSADNRLKIWNVTGGALANTLVEPEYLSSIYSSVTLATKGSKRKVNASMVWMKHSLDAVIAWKVSREH
jgi:hypothetical protein